MLDKYAEVIKKEHIVMDGSVCISPLGDVNVGSQIPTTIPKSTMTAASHVKVIESNNEHAIIEVTCACGSKNQIECNF